MVLPTLITDVKIEALKKLFSNQLAKLEVSSVDMQKDLDEKTSIIKHLADKFENFGKVLEENLSIKEDLKEKDAKINGLEIKLDELEKSKQKYKKQHEKKIKEIENQCKQKMSKERIPELPEKKDIQCNKCDYTTTSRQGLQIHNSDRS